MSLLSLRRVNFGRSLIPTWSIHIVYYLLLTCVPWVFAWQTRETLPPETWELAKNQTEIEALRVKFGGIIVDREATPAAFLPGWPEATYVVLLAMFSQMRLGAAVTLGNEEARELVPHPYTSQEESSAVRRRHLADTEDDWFHGPLTMIQIIFTSFVSIAWTVSFILTEVYTDKAGWTSVVAWGFPLWIGLQMVKRKYSSGYCIVVFTAFQWGASLTTIIQRWKGTIGTIAYIITDSHSCQPHSSFSFLTAGIRTRAFKIMQTTNFAYATMMIPILIGAVFDGKDHAGYASRYVVSLFITCGPVVYEIIYMALIASKGTPVVISGNCMLVELSPRFGYFDSEIVFHWKLLMAITGL
jgi:hypothetical protein